MDPLSDVMSLLKPLNYKVGGYDAGGDVSLRFPEYEGIFCYAVMTGQCWLSVEGSDPVHLKTGDCVVLPKGRAFCLASDLALEPIDGVALMKGKPNGNVSVADGGGGRFLIAGHFHLDRKYADVLLSVLPPIVHITGQEARAELRWTLDRMMQELREPKPGGFLVMEHLAHLLLVQALRLHLAEGAEQGIGWLFALADKQMSIAITAMHEDPGRRWTLRALAELVGMSRTAFASRFKATVGSAPMEYLIRWRMLLAADRFTTANQPVSVVGRSLGYESESAFSSAFKRVMGCSPRQYGRRASSAEAPLPGRRLSALAASGLRPAGNTVLASTDA